MSKSMKRVRLALEAAGLDPEIRETALARTAEDAAAAIGCGLDQIVKSIIFHGQVSDRAILFLTAGGNRVRDADAAALAGEPLGKADAALVRAQTGFAIGGVAPVGHLSPIRAFLDLRLRDFSTVWAAAGTPHHVFAIAPDDLIRIAQAQVANFVS
ncbi:YbaK/EbsC family protein [Pontibaca salina]|uniref:YbaK/EbsC family protein n=1 Tax=Pontibaca salina TaxID=2795731 RepID=A0A934M1N9_9RHOB|nr:YbaK/EbsC family protein [Pontibaca salina]MBI6629831.1 YbaK/EbsC family protein [Pontibaca salina]